MPSPRAVIADIINLGLDPNVAHTNIKASGHLAAPRVVDAIVKPKVFEKKVELQEPKVKEVEVVAVVEVVKDESSEVVASDVETPTISDDVVESVVDDKKTFFKSKNKK